MLFLIVEIIRKQFAITLLDAELKLLYCEKVNPFLCENCLNILNNVEEIWAKYASIIIVLPNCIAFTVTDSPTDKLWGVPSLGPEHADS